MGSVSNNSPPGAERSRRARPRLDRRQALIDAAIELLAEGNSADISAAAISRRRAAWSTMRGMVFRD